MLNVTTLVLIFLLPLFTQGQSSYDSLKQIYSAEHVFEQREKGSTDSYIKKTLAETKNPEMQQLIACAMAENLYGSGNWVNSKNLLRLVEDVIAAPQSERAKKIALDTKAEITRTLIGTKIEDIRLPNPADINLPAPPDGQLLSLTDYYTSKFDYVVVDLWATWCGPCIAEMKKFNPLKQQYNIEFYSISFDDDINKVQKFVKRNPDYSWPIAFAGKESTLMDYFKIKFIPAFIIVDRNGIIVSHTVGKGLEDELKKLYKK